jgi:hypothetical protein
MTKQYFIARVCKKNLSYRRRHLGLSNLERIQIRENNKIMEELAINLRLAEFSGHIVEDDDQYDAVINVIKV